MNKYHKILAVLMLLTVVCGAGCSSKGSETDVTGQEDKVSEGNGVRAGELTNADVDPVLAGLMITNDNPDITVTEVKLNDVREFEDDTNHYGIVVTYRNDGEQPVYITSDFGLEEYQDKTKNPQMFTVLYSGETKQGSFGLKYSEYDLNNLPTMNIVSHKTVMPEVSENLTEFKFRQTWVDRTSFAPDAGQFVDIHSISFEVDEERSWKTVVMEVSTSEDKDVFAKFKLFPINFMSKERMETEVTIPAGQTLRVVMPIKSFKANDIEHMRITAYVPNVIPA